MYFQMFRFTLKGFFFSKLKNPHLNKKEVTIFNFQNVFCAIPEVWLITLNQGIKFNENKILNTEVQKSATLLLC